MKFWCSKIRINGKEVIKSGLLFGRKLEWRKDGTRAVKRRIKKMEKDLKNQIMLLVFSGVTYGTAPLLSCR